MYDKHVTYTRAHLTQPGKRAALVNLDQIRLEEERAMITPLPVGSSLGSDGKAFSRTELDIAIDDLIN